MNEVAKQLNRLGELIGDAGKNYYERIKIADLLMRNKVWLASEFQNDDYKAAEFLEDRYFHDLSGSMSIFELMHIFRKFPNESDWRERKWNLKILYSQCKVKVTDKHQRRSVTVSEFEEVNKQFKETEYKLKDVAKKLKHKEDELVSLRERVSELEAENHQLKGRIQELERIVQGRLVEV